MAYTYRITAGLPEDEDKYQVEGLTVLNLEEAVAQCLSGFVCGQGIPITIEQIPTPEEKEESC